MSSKTWTVASPLLYGIGLVICLLALLMLLAAPPPADAQGGGTITGTVFDDGGSTVAGADVWAEPYWGGMGYGTQSDLNGVYTFTGLISDVYRVGAYKFGYATEYFSDTVDYEAAQPIFVSGGTTAGIDFYLGPGGDLTGTVALVGNLSPITSAFVDASPADPNLWWGSGGQVSGSGVSFFDLTVAAGGFVTLVSPVQVTGTLLVSGALEAAAPMDVDGACTSTATGVVLLGLDPIGGVVLGSH
ncbi:MAG: carboxypeptidase-like regulatory domain-containing protein, partial [Anaerolineae bacterium]